MRAVNLLPRDALRRRPKRNPLVLGGAVAFVLVTAVLALGFQSQSGKARDLQATLDGLQTELAALPPAPKGRADESALTAAKQQREAAVSGALGHRVAWDRVLRELSLVLPDDVWLSGVSARSPIPLTAASVASTPPAGADAGGLGASIGSGTTTPRAAPPGPSLGFTLNGYTYSQEAVARFLSRLQVVPELKNVQLQSSALQRATGRPVVQFTVVADVRVSGQPS